MQSQSILIFGGTGAVGCALVRLLTSQGARVAFTYHSSVERAQALEKECGALAIAVDLSRSEQVSEVYRELDEKKFSPHALIYAAVQGCPKSMGEVTLEDWQAIEAVNVRSVWVACQEFTRRFKKTPHLPGQILLLSALDRAQILPLPSAFASTQGALGSMAMALGKELGPLGICVNLVALSALEGGMSEQMTPQMLEQFKNFSALKRLGKPEEIARTVAWFATRNTYMTGRVLAANGGI